MGLSFPCFLLHQEIDGKKSLLNPTLMIGALPAKEILHASTCGPLSF